MEMERYQRKTPLDVVKSMWVEIRKISGEELEHTRLVKQLQKRHPSAGDKIESYVSHAVVDGLIQIVERPKKPKPKSVYHYTLPDVANCQFPDGHPDVYCYECHLEGTMLKCSDCVRVFHRGCVKTTTEKQLELEGFTAKYKRVNISEFGLADGTNRSASSPVSVAAESCNSSVSPVHVDDNENHTTSMQRNGTPTTVKNELRQPGVKQEEEDCKAEMELDEPQFVGVVRPPDRRLEERMNTPTVKPEDNNSSIMDSEEFMFRYCYPCRQVHGNQYNTPPNMSQGELNYLLKFLFEQYRSWLPDDTYSPDRRKTDASEIVDNMELCKKLMLRLPITLNTIEQKLEKTQYKTLEEFSADIQDIAHNMAIIHGANSVEFDAAMYFVADCVFDLYEIRHCPDCFRHSNEKAEPDWFARPCVTRHELVFAKLKGYQYWPAKVIRVYNNKYDVRFFGDKHSRAVVESTSVKPIDSDFDVLKINPKQRGFQKSMDELHKHQALINLPKEYYAYGSQPAAPVNVLIRSNSLTFPPVASQSTSSGRKRGRKPRTSVPKVVNDSSSDNVSLELVSIEPACPGTPTRAINSPQNGNEKRQTRQTDKRPPEVSDNNAVSPSPSKKSRLNNDDAQLNGSSSSSTIMTPTRSSEASSVEAGPSDESLKQRSPRIKAQLKRQHPDDVVKLRALLNEMDDINKVKELAVTALQEDIIRWQQKIRELISEYNFRITQVKHKQWCKHCDHESILHCCWNTSYCSRDCQEKDWPKHKRSHKYAKP